MELKDIRGPTMQQAGYHHANMLASHLRVDLNNQQTQMLALMQDLVPELPPTNHVPAEEAHVQQAANATIGDNVQLQMLQILQAIQAAQVTGNQHGQ